LGDVDLALSLHFIALFSAIIVLGYTVQVNRIFRGLPKLQKPWYVMILAVVFLILHTGGMVIRMYLHLPPGHPIAFETGLTLVGFVAALSYSMLSLVRAWTPPKVDG